MEADRLADPPVPVGSRRDALLVDPGLEARLVQAPLELADFLLILAGVAEEDLRVGRRRLRRGNLCSGRAFRGLRLRPPCVKLLDECLGSPFFEDLGLVELEKDDEIAVRPDAVVRYELPALRVC